MESPAQYIAKLEADLRAANTAVERLTRERAERDASLRGQSASTAAATAELAIGRLIESEAIVEAGIEWRKAERDRLGSSVVVAREDKFKTLLDARIKAQESAS